MYKPLNTDIKQVKSEIDTLNTELNVLTTEYIKKDSYLEQIEDMSDYISLVDESFPAFTTQEMIIHTLIQLETDIESLLIPSYSMSFPVAILSDGEYKDEKTGELKYKENLLETSVTLSLDMTYADMKKMLTFIRGYENKLSIQAINISSNLNDNTVSTSYTLNFYALVSEDRPFIPEDYFGPFEPKEDSIFSPYESYGQSFDSGLVDGEVASEENDFILNLSPIFADRSTVIMYKEDDSDGKSYIYTDSPTFEPLEIIFEQVNDTYRYKYKTSSAQYPKNYSTGEIFSPGNYIDLGVYSTPRSDADDLNGVNVTLINNTDLPLKVLVTSDDAEQPRFNLIYETGDITLTRKQN
jgi:hypothetical protein